MVLDLFPFKFKFFVLKQCSKYRSNTQLLVILLNSLKIKLIAFIQSYYFIISFYKNAEDSNAIYLERLKLEYISC